MNIEESTQSREARLGEHTARILPGDLHVEDLRMWRDAEDELRLLRAMGAETANVHLDSPRAVPAVQKDLASRHTGWLRAATTAMIEAARDDLKAWKRNGCG